MAKNEQRWIDENLLNDKEFSRFLSEIEISEFSTIIKYGKLKSMCP